MWCQSRQRHRQQHGSGEHPPQETGPYRYRVLLPRFRPSRGRAGVSLGLDGCEVRLCDPCARVSRVSRVSTARARTQASTLRYYPLYRRNPARARARCG